MLLGLWFGLAYPNLISNIVFQFIGVLSLILKYNKLLLITKSIKLKQVFYIFTKTDTDRL